MRDIEAELIAFRRYINAYLPDIPGLYCMNVQNSNEVLMVWRKNIIKTTSILYNSYLFGKISEQEFFKRFDKLQNLFLHKN